MSFHTIDEGRQARRRIRLAAGLALLLAGVGLSRLASGGQSGAATPNGKELFTTYCASCHGVDASGNGPLARALRHQPTDLTALSARNGGMFPAARARRIVEGREVESHGEREMPVWGDAFRSTSEGRSSESANARIDAVVRYLETIQSRAAQ